MNYPVRLIDTMQIASNSSINNNYESDKPIGMVKTKSAIKASCF